MSLRSVRFLRRTDPRLDYLSMSSTWTLPDDLTVPEPVEFFPAAGEKLPQHWSKCFGCGDDQPAGMAMSFRLVTDWK